MKSLVSRQISYGIVLLSSLLIFSPQALSQTTDSLSQTPNGSLQFHLLGTLGIYYLADWGGTSYLRVGMNGTLKYSNNSGDENGYFNYSSISGTANDLADDHQTSTSFGISISGVYVWRITEYANTTLYSGAGPMISYSSETQTDNASWGRTSLSDTTTETRNYNSTDKSWGTGALAILGVRNRVFSHVSLTAEVSLSALYQWSSRTTASLSMQTYGSTVISSTNGGDNSSYKGWWVYLSNIHIGVIVDL